MKWLELCIDTAQDGLDKLEAMLSALGIDGIEIEDEADFQSFLAGNEKYWDYVDDDLLAQKKGKCRIKCYLEDNEEAAAQLGSRAPGYGGCEKSPSRRGARSHDLDGNGSSGRRLGKQLETVLPAH